MATPGRSSLSVHTPPRAADSSPLPVNELRSARRELARARRSLRDIREALNNIVDNGTAENEEVIENLEHQELEALDRVSSGEARVTALQDLVDATHSEATRQASSLGGVTGRESPSNPSTSEGAGETTLSPSVGIPREDSRQEELRPEESAPRFELSPDQPFPDASRIVSGKKATTSEIGKVPVPKLQSVPYLASHLTLVEELFVEANGGVRSTSGVFQPHDHLKFTCYTKLVGSLAPYPDVSRAAHEVAATARYDWRAICSELRHQFCRKDHLRKEYKTSLATLKFPGVEAVDSFLRKCSSVYHLYRDVYGEDRSELRLLIRAIVHKLPQTLRLSVIDSIHDTSKVLKPTESDQGIDWELLLPYDGLDDTSSIVSVIRQRCRNFSEASVPVSSPGDAQDQRPVRTPVRGTADTLSQVSASTSAQGTESLSQWARKYAAVYVVGGPGVVGDSNSVIRSDGSRTVKLRSGQGHLWFVGFNKKDEGAEAIKDLESDQFKVRTFQFRSRRSTPHRASVPGN